MLRELPLFALGFILSAALGAVNEDLSAPSTRPATSAEVSEIQDYTRTLSKEWLKDYFAIDLDAISWRLRRSVWLSTPAAASKPRIFDEGPEGPPLPPPSAVIYNMDLRLEQYDDIRRLQYDPRDIPFAVRFDAAGAMLGEKLRLHTSVFIPLSWKDEMRAEAMVPLPNAPGWMGSLLGASGFGQGWDLRSTYGNRLGVSSVQTGLGTQWMKIWSLNYEFRVRFGQDIYEESQWLKLGTSF